MSTTWIPHLGKFESACKQCGSIFNGRKNRLYCSDACKARFNNDLAGTKKLAERKITSGYLTNLEILMELMKGSENEILAHSMSYLNSLGFDISAPFNRIILEGDVWFKVSDYAFKPLETTQEVELRKLHHHD